jgi:hypothetical protein
VLVLAGKPQKQALAIAGVRGLLIYCSDYKVQSPDYDERRPMAGRHALVRSPAAICLLGVRQARRGC